MPEGWIERGWEAVNLSLAKDIAIIIGCSRPEALAQVNATNHRLPYPPPPAATSILITFETLYIYKVH
jgi:hypothetical protein